MSSLHFRTKKNGVPVLSKKEIENIGEKVIYSYKPRHINNPMILDIELFIENYVELEMDYQNLTHDGSILGMTVFNDCSIPIYNVENEKAMRLAVNEGTILLDNTLLQEDQLRRGRFTLAHESAHWLLHRRIYQKDKDQISLFDVFETEEKKLPIIKCRASDIEYKGKRELKTDNDWMEWQADYMASVLLMPRKAFSKVVKGKFESAKIDKGFYQLGTDFEKDIWADVIAYELAELFEVSVTATKNRLKNLGFIRDDKDCQQNLF